MNLWAWRQMAQQADEQGQVSLVYDRARQCREALVDGLVSAAQARSFLAQLASFVEDRLNIFLDYDPDPEAEGYEEGLRNIVVGLNSWRQHLQGLEEDNLVDFLASLLEKSLAWEQRLSLGTRLLREAAAGCE